MLVSLADVTKHRKRGGSQPLGLFPPRSGGQSKIRVWAGLVASRGPEGGSVLGPSGVASVLAGPWLLDMLHNLCLQLFGLLTCGFFCVQISDLF